MSEELAVDEEAYTLQDLENLLRQADQARDALLSKIMEMRESAPGGFIVDANSAAGRMTLLINAITLGTAGMPRPVEPGVSHLLAMRPTRSELATLLRYVKEQHRMILSPIADDLQRLDTSLVIERHEPVIARAIEIFDEVAMLG